ncbi:phosphatidylinositol-specific phospholipase C domain-containing protein [Streptomyces sp. NPDC005890]|uniref:phosphatidylinositol-specific phospholipase C domain-containing protein n=1 Tax=Streptomyces sp. NPDC005890 TaxID=3154568 RepID=UPI00340BAC07
MRKRWLARTVSVVAAGMLGCAGIAPAAAAASGESYRNLEGGGLQSDWMAPIPDSTSLGRLSLPGTHDTMSIRGGPSTATQEDFGTGGATLRAQLEHGIRAIDIRVRVVDGRFTIHHGLVYQQANFSDVLSVLGGFLDSHPKETVLMSLHAECTAETFSCTDQPTSTDDAARLAIFRDYLANDGHARDHFWAPSAGGQGPAAMPHLHDVRGKIVLAKFTNPHGGHYSGYGLARMSDSGFEQNQSDVPTVFDISDKWQAVKEHFQRTNAGPSDAMYWNWTSGGSATTWPNTVAGGFQTAIGQQIPGVNEQSYDFLKSDNHTVRTGVVWMDYPGWALVQTIIRMNFWGPITGPGGMCVDVSGASTANGTSIQLADCNGTRAQRWTARSDQSLHALGKCLDVASSGTTPGTKIQLWDCNDTGAQKWQKAPGGALLNPQSGLCLDAPGGQAVNGSRLQIWTCNGLDSQRWTVNPI